ncbi:hypothetical protein H634G_06958 [Metarhizium anisopliae BRIP 53293]|uniref:Uncharacterized protein n=1 Tax=Metarhizium anisopliae BRIP 53293 TaxID=1291518 RepID=A0A0D9NVT9_METAN|nr:hypothetical protein H634G_06958 [Metarhizium anisopliae BRIP 53293]KJK84741.1 hypothetical protein H633G_11492 [Metarhizium anisopliae BRIP 53284]
MANLNRITEELRRLEKEEELTEELLIERRRKAQLEIDEALNRLMRLRRMRRHLREKGLEMARRDFASLEEMEDADRKKEEEEARKRELEQVQRQESEAVRDAQNWGAFDVLDWGALLSAESQAAGDTAVIGAGNSLGAP